MRGTSLFGRSILRWLRIQSYGVRDLRPLRDARRRCLYGVRRFPLASAAGC